MIESLRRAVEAAYDHLKHRPTNSQTIEITKRLRINQSFDISVSAFVESGELAFNVDVPQQNYSVKVHAVAPFVKATYLILEMVLQQIESLEKNSKCFIK